MRDRESLNSPLIASPGNTRRPNLGTSTIRCAQLVAADINGSGPCLHGIQDKAGTTKQNWSARCQYNVTGWVSMWAYDMLSQ